MASKGFSVNAAALLAHSRRDYREVEAVTQDLVPLIEVDGISEPGIMNWRELRTTKHSSGWDA
ncbi:MAG: hypothetical protein H0W55_01230 [Actinobacteria bacterium]|nr:hypothetical protein [Actinomycetota bacterium]MDQ3532833.1 hypothetical protein [Actinomycetota bacterium]